MAGIAVSFKIATAETRAGLADINRRVDRASMYTVRQAGRVVKQTARRTVRVYQGDRADIPKGRLKNSIHSDRMLRREGLGAYAVTVGPRGWPARGYAGKIEDLDSYMRAGRDAAVAQARAIAAVAWTRATRGRRG